MYFTKSTTIGRFHELLGLFSCDGQKAPLPWELICYVITVWKYAHELGLHCLDLMDCFCESVFLSHFMFCLSPFIRDGKISREEMIDYFMKASSLLSCKMGFIHTFIETTYVKPTFCEHCAGFVSRMQAYRNRFIIFFLLLHLVFSEMNRAWTHWLWSAGLFIA